MGNIKGSGPSSEDVFLFKTKREIIELFKSQLQVIEDLTVEHDEAMQKLIDKLPNEYKTYVSLADHMTDGKCEQIRKRILDRGNSCYNNIEKIFEEYKKENG